MELAVWHKGQQVTIVFDDIDMSLVAQYRWYIRRDRSGGLRPYTFARLPGGNWERNLSMPNIIMGKPPRGYCWDHKDRNPLNNRRNNFRLVNRGQNRHNSRVAARSGYRGVFLSQGPRRNPWQAAIAINKKRIFLGRFETAEEAARAYDRAAIQFYGDFASTNFPRSEYISQVPQEV